MFGHPIGLSFNKKGTTHNTVFGGISSLVVLSFLLFYFYIHLDKMINHKEDKISTKLESINLLEAPEVKLNDMKFILPLNLVYAKLFAPIEYTDDVKRFLTIQSYQNEWDYTAKPPKYPTRTPLGIKSCTEEDFSRTELLTERFLALKNNGIDLICPENNDVTFLGSD